MDLRAVRAGRLSLLLVLFCCIRLAAATPSTQPGQGLYVRVALVSPADRRWRVHIVAEMPGGKSKGVFAGGAVASTAAGVELLPAGQATGWVDLSDVLTPQGATIRFVFETQPPIDKVGVEARVDVAAATDDAAILRSVTDHDSGNIVSVRIPPEPAKAKDRILSIREDAQRRLDDVTDLITLE
jgi:hypothetical protein